MKLLHLKQRSDEWLALRRSKIGASDIAELMTGSEKAINNLWTSKIHGEERFVTDAMREGIELEEDARNWFSVWTDRVYSESCGLHDNGWLMASLDGYNEKSSRAVEIKVPVNMPSSVFEYSGYKKAFWQIQAHYAVYEPVLIHLLMYRPERQICEPIFKDSLALHKLLLKGEWFYNCLVEMRLPFAEPKSRKKGETVG